MTTGERLVILSSLSTGTAMKHFLSIITGAGSGAVIDVIMQEPDIITITEQEPIDIEVQEPDIINITQEHHGVELESPDIGVELD